MRLLIVRHGDPDYSIDSLTEKGWKEAEYLSERLSKLDVKDFYVTATQELVVPRSMPITLLILFPLFLVRCVCGLIFLQSILPDGCDHFLVQL